MKKQTVGLALAVAFATAACGDAGSISELLSGGNGKKGAKFKPAQTDGPITGAIFTTDSEGELVNGNIYDEKEDVYLNGGPRKPGAAGLPDGDYYYLVSDPGCTVQLAGPTADAPNNTAGKIITVVDGEFTELMQLAPYADTPNNGGEYKVWVTPVDDLDESAPSACFGFLPNRSKTDNFKVRKSVVPPPNGDKFYCISGLKFYDRDDDGDMDSPEGPVDGTKEGVAGIEIVLSNDQGVITTTSTSATGQWSFCGLPPGDYHVHEELPEAGFWEQTFPANGEGHDVTIVDDDITGLLFGNVCHVGSFDGPVPPDPEDCGEAPIE
jgi:hypothetical protein